MTRRIYIQRPSNKHFIGKKEKKKNKFVLFREKERKKAKEKLKDEEERSVVAGAMAGYVGGDLG